MVALASEETLPLRGPEPLSVRRQVEIRGAVARLFRDGAKGEIIISGPAGTGKTFAILSWIHWRCSKERLRVLILRKTEESLRSSALVTFNEEVLTDFDGKESLPDGVKFFGGNTIRPAQYIFTDTGSIICIGGLDRVSKVKSSQWDIIFINEATELTLDEWETVTGRVDRPSMHNRPPSVVLGDCNPDAPTHWVLLRSGEGSLDLWTTTHVDNPSMHDGRDWTPAGQAYRARLNSLTGVRRARLRDGLWVAAEGQVYEGWNPEVHLLPSRPVPAEWPRYLSIDFGYTHPFVAGWWALDPDDRLILYREIYMTRRLVSDHSKQIIKLSKGEPRFRAVICDHDAEDRATFERETGYRTVPAKKLVSPGIQAVANRLLPQPDGRPRLYVYRDSLVELDKSLRERGLPTRTAEEYPSYVWDQRQGQKKGDVPVKENDHGMDMTRYAVAYFDLKKKSNSAPKGVPQRSTWMTREFERR